VTLRTESLDELLQRAPSSPDAAAQDALWGDARRLLAGSGLPFERHLEVYRAVFSGRREEDGPPVAWMPDERTVADANLTELRKHVGLDDYAAVHAWSVSDRPAYWDVALHRIGLTGSRRPDVVLDESRGVEDPAWFPGAKWNAASMAFRIEDKDRTAIVAGEEGQKGLRRVTYGELMALADRFSHGLRARGLVAGDAVALYMPMTVECVALYLGVVQAGMAVVSIADSFAPAEVATRLRLGDAKLLVTVDGYRRGGRYVKLAPKAREAAGDVPVLVIGRAEPSPRDTLWEDFLGPERPFDPVDVDPDHTSNILFSSGTTGEPKAIPWTHLTPLKAAADAHYHQDVHPDDVVAWPTNIGWMMGPWLIYASLANRAAMALYHGAPTGDGFLRFCREAGVTVLGLVPSLVRAWRQQGTAAPDDLPRIRVFSSTGEASNAEDYLYLMSLAGYRAPVIEYCGGTEVGGGHLTGTVVQPASPATFTTPALGIDFVVLDEAGRPVPPGGHGELFLVPPSVGLSQRLLNRDHHAEYYADCPKGPRGVTLRRHGDQVQVLHKGFYTAQGRADDTMNLGGIKVASVELERTMDAHPAVRETAAVAVPERGGGADRLIVFAVLEKGPDAGSPAPADLKAELQHRIRDRLNPLFRIHDVVVRDNLPRTASNKVMRRVLRKEYEEAEGH